MLKKLAILSILTLFSFGAYAELDPDSPTVLVTGSNRGIGLGIVTQYAKLGWNVIATSRRPLGNPGLKALEELVAEYPKVVIEQIDVTDTAMIRGVAEKYKDQAIDVLINNAAAVSDTFAVDMSNSSIPYTDIDFDAAQLDFNVNSLGPMRMAQAFMPHVMRSEQKVFASITSIAGSFAIPLPGPGAMNYGASKAALNKYMVLLSIAMKEEGVKVVLFQPVMVASKKDMGDLEYPGLQTVEVAVAILVDQIDNLTEESIGRITNFSRGGLDPF